MKVTVTSDEPKSLLSVWCELAATDASVSRAGLLGVQGRCWTLTEGEEDAGGAGLFSGGIPGFQENGGIEAPRVVGKGNPGRPVTEDIIS